MFMVEKKSLTEYSYSVKDGKSKSFPRCHLDSRVHSPALCKILTYLRQLTYAFTSQSTRILKSFDCALSGPFNALHFHPIPSNRGSLWAHGAFLSPPHRFNVIKPQAAPVVKQNFLPN